MGDINDYELISHYKDAVCDMNYNPTRNNYNKTKYTLEELESEILRRMSN